MKPNREIELQRHIAVLRDALQDAPHPTSLKDGGPKFYQAWYSQQRGPALDSTAPRKWQPHLAVPAAPKE